MIAELPPLDHVDGTEETVLEARGDIMIVDDHPANLMLLEEMLTRQGHEVRSFPLGRLALAAAMRTPPDLILLDINMPEMNGYEVCEHLKSALDLANIPVIFLSALNETQDKVKAFESGAVDYISKPFQFEEVHARVETHLKLHNLQRALKLHNEHLEEAVAERTLELAEANQRLTLLDRSKNAFLNLISHEFRTLLQGFAGRRRAHSGWNAGQREEQRAAGDIRAIAPANSLHSGRRFAADGNRRKGGPVPMHVGLLERGLEPRRQERERVRQVPPGDLHHAIGGPGSGGGR